MILTKLSAVMSDRGMRSQDLAVKTGLSTSTIDKAKALKPVRAITAKLIAHGLRLKEGDLL